SINDFSSDMHDVNFMAVKIGDVNDSAIPSDLSATDERNEVTVGTLPLYTTDRWITAGEEVIVNVSTKAWSKLVGYQFTIDFDETGLAFVEPMTADVAEINSANFGLGRATAGVIVTNFAKANAVTLEKDTDLFRLKFHALRTARLSELLRINSSVLAAEAYNDNLEQLDVQWTFDKNNTTEASFALYQNQPNPFSTQTSIEFQLPEAATATLSIYDISGQLVQVYSRDFVAGQHHFLIEQADLKRSGTFYYQLKTPTHTATRTMILLE
ncbi:MAG: T9SS type A sorting domain-containing protein, partial [Bacteroidota bacterium]